MFNINFYSINYQQYWQFMYTDSECAKIQYSNKYSKMSKIRVEALSTQKMFESEKRSLEQGYLSTALVGKIRRMLDINGLSTHNQFQMDCQLKCIKYAVDHVLFIYRLFVAQITVEQTREIIAEEFQLFVENYATKHLNQVLNYETFMKYLAKVYIECECIQAKQPQQVLKVMRKFYATVNSAGQKRKSIKEEKKMQKQTFSIINHIQIISSPNKRNEMEPTTHYLQQRMPKNQQTISCSLGKSRSQSIEQQQQLNFLQRLRQLSRDVQDEYYELYITGPSATKPQSRKITHASRLSKVKPKGWK